MKKIIFFALFCSGIFAIFLLFDRLYPLNLDMLNKPKSQILYDKNGKTISMKISSDGFWRFYTNIDEIPPNLTQSVLFFEDQYYYYHPGVNPFSMFRAVFYNIIGQNRIGASTITMQVARMMNPKKRTYINKILEVFNAFQLEWHFSKDEILQMYFNIAPYGGNIEGVKAAAFFYFDKSLNELSSAEAALLSIIPKNPNKNRLDRSSDINQLKNRLIKQMYDEGTLDKSQYQRAKKEPFRNLRHNAPNKALHYSNLAFKNKIVNSNLDFELQTALENFLNKSIINLTPQNVNNASAVLIDNYKMQVVAYIGSHNVLAKNGQNDGVMSIKNVGSTLKPFIYAKALENGFITPRSKLVDTEIYLNNYTPQNFNENFIGITDASTALLLSLNIPAVKLNFMLKDDSLYELLNDANLTMKPKEYYGESITLGGISMSLLNLTHLYTIFAHQGELKPLEIAGEYIDKNVKLLTPQSTYITANMLINAPRAYLNSVWKNTQNKPYIMFKTGTTASSRDLYTIALTPQYTLGIWMGNFDSQKTRNLSGGMSAAIVAFNMFDYIDKKIAQSHFVAPKGISKKEVCTDAFSFNECKDLEEDLTIDGVDLNRSCSFYRNEELFFMLKNGYLTTDDVKNSPCFDKLKDVKPVFNEIDGKNFTSYGVNLRLMIKCTAIFGDQIYINIDDTGYKQMENSKSFFHEFYEGFHSVKCLDEQSNQNTANFNVTNF